jgi:hypothetical protein
MGSGIGQYFNIISTQDLVVAHFIFVSFDHPFIKMGEHFFFLFYFIYFFTSIEYIASFNFIIFKINEKFDPSFQRFFEF